MIAEVEDLELRLVGYVAHASHGFALPLFGQHDRANTLYVADCRPSGDHSGVISRFDVHEPSTHAWLPVERPETVRVGDPWLDVFLWNDAVFVGAAADVWTLLQPVRAELELSAPLSLLDAAVNAGAVEREALAPLAMSYVTDRFGPGRAKRWRLGTLRRQAAVLVRRLSAQLREVPATVDLLSADLTRAHLHLTEPLAEELRKVEALAPLVEDMRRFAEALGLGFDVDIQTAPAPGDRAEKREDVTKRDDREDGLAGSILVVASGSRAREIARHIADPAWSPTDRRDEGRSKVIQVVNGDDARAVAKLASSYEIVVALVDDTTLSEGPKSSVSALLDRMATLGALRILVPALPELHPAGALDGRSELRSFGRWRPHALLDTAQARSPFWWGNPKRSLDRRIADIISGAATVCLSGRVANAVRNRKDGQLIVFAMDAERARSSQAYPDWALGSESTWFEPGPGGGRGRIHFKERIEVVRRDGPTIGHALIECRSLEVGFGSFAIAVMNDLFGDRPGLVRHGPDMAEPPGTLMSALKYRRHAFAFHRRAATESMPLLVTAEAPTLEALLAADQTGWKVVRYTDRPTLRALMLAERGDDRRNVPGEISLGRIATSDINRRLATRGVDTRDVVRLTRDQLHEWLDSVSPEDRDRLRSEIRPLRVSADVSEKAETPAFAARRKRLLDGRFQDDPALRALMRVLKISERELMERRPYKRAADLDTCWAPPADAFMRFALADGEIPPLVARLGPEEIVLQTSFIIDGDWSTPALFRSRVFGVWAAATLSRSSSWMSRFSVGTTFAGFPIAPPFRIVGTEGTGCALSCADGELLELAQEVESHIERIANAGGGASWKSAQRSEELGNLPSARKLEARILEAYGLKAGADDLSILERLVIMNGQLDRA